MIRPRASAASSTPSDDVARSDQCPHAVGCDIESTAVDSVTEHVGVELPDDVLPGDPAGPLLIRAGDGCPRPRLDRPVARCRHAAAPPGRVPTARSARPRSPGSRRVASNAGSGSADTDAHPTNRPELIGDQPFVGGRRSPADEQDDARRRPNADPPTARSRPTSAPTRISHVDRSNDASGDERHDDGDENSDGRLALRRTSGADHPHRRRLGHVDSVGRAGRSPGAGVRAPVTHDRPRLRGSPVVPHEDSPVRPAAGPGRPGALGARRHPRAQLRSTAGRAAGLRLILGVCAAPGLLAIGVPFASTSMYPVGIGISVALWIAVGVVASRIATRNPVATFVRLLAGVPLAGDRRLDRRPRRARRVEPDPRARTAVARPRSHRDEVADRLDLRRADAPHLLEVVDRGERAVLRRGARRSPRRSPGRSRAASPARSASAVLRSTGWSPAVGRGRPAWRVPGSTRRVAADSPTARHGDAVAVGDRCGEVEGVGVSVGQRPAGGDDGVGDALARARVRRRPAPGRHR